jgi:hypothetical protein
MGTPLKLQIGGETVFVCCEGCKAGALSDPQRTAARVQELRAAAGKERP